MTLNRWLDATLVRSTFQDGSTIQDEEDKVMEMPQVGDPLNENQIIAFANLVLKCIDQEYPNKPSNVLVDEASVLTPRQMFPAFYGCFDWHSAIHGHWVLVRLIKLYPETSVQASIRWKLAEHLSADNLLREAEFFRAEHNRSFERMYGWAWAFRLITELETWDDPDAKLWRDNLRPLEDVLVQRTLDFLPKLTFPIRTGVHPDTAFALGQTLDYARAVGNRDLESLIVGRAKDYYLNDRDFNSEYEPSGEDFFSASLNEADLMRRILPSSEYETWLTQFLPKLVDGGSNLYQPVAVSDVTDGKLVHLAGLNLSRAWCFQGIASAITSETLKRQLLASSADHLQAGLSYVFSGHYEGEHWLATFALYAITKVGIGH
ncbi:MAG TPA: DUF2891 domain-containing protein [Pirellulaceae bacterium]|nr:DUF2891 domain-containing protein [Pirellulaceae bacterium]HMO91756.1 DUF2891 domain-containing protein [Pirellulaceae bacterium]HMP69555.1 DUF2891 domain-containing protein [Pirellulaceae bacterium]